MLRFACSASAALVLTAFVAGQPTAIGSAKSLAPFVATPQNIVDKMLALAGVKPGETVYDLGCGDGRVLIAAAQKYRAKAVGVEISQRLVKEASENIKRAGMEKSVSVLHADLMEVDLAPANVVVLYLLRDSNDLVRPKLEKTLRPGTRIVSHDYEIRGWKPTAVERSEANKRDHSIYVYTAPQSFGKK
ncbi:MAG: class I SAM-dependent methyltransferase [Verrucomicrobiota bacterium]